MSDRAFRMEGHVERGRFSMEMGGGAVSSARWIRRVKKLHECGASARRPCHPCRALQFSVPHQPSPLTAAMVPASALVPAPALWAWHCPKIAKSCFDT